VYEIALIKTKTGKMKFAADGKRSIAGLRIWNS
jgi:hypothetical protein